jgi:hypothetical protein
MPDELGGVFQKSAIVTSPVERIAMRLGVTEAEIAAAIKKVGFDQDRVEDYLRSVHGRVPL